MIYRYTEQDISRAWQTALDFTRQYLVPSLRVKTLLGDQSSPVELDLAGAVKQASASDPKNWYAQWQFVGYSRSTAQDLGGLAASVLAEYGTPVSQLSESGQIAHTIYSTLLEASGRAADRYIIYGSVKSPGAFMGYQPVEEVRPIRLSAEDAGSLDSDKLLREMVYQSTPVVQFLSKENFSNIAGTASLIEALTSATSLRKAGSFFGIDANEIDRLISSLSGVGGSKTPFQTIGIMGHEMAHATVQLRPSIGTEVMSEYLSGKIPLSEVMRNFAIYHELRNEAYADAFSMAVSLNPASMLSVRYLTGLRDELRYAHKRGDLRAFTGWKFGDPIRVRVIDPRVVDDPDSPLAQALGRYTQEFENVVVGTSRKTGDPLAEAAASSYQVDAYTLKSNMTDPNKRYDVIHNYIANYSLKLFNKLVQDVYDPKVSPERDLQLDPDSEFVLRHSGSRLWTVGYLVAKARPDLIGQELLLTPTGVQTTSGEEISIPDILPDIQPESFGRIETHPVLLERAFEMVKVYNRAREALRRGVIYRSQGANAQEVIENWRELFLKEVVNPPKATVDLPDPATVSPQPTRGGLSGLRGMLGGLRQLLQARSVQQTSGEQVVTGQGSNVIQSAYQHSSQP